MVESEQKSVRCRWCGKKEVEPGYQTCPVCHRVQNPLLGRLQIWNASNWLAVLIAGIAIYFSYQQTNLARLETEETRAERRAAEDAVLEAQSAVDRARTARDQARLALAKAGEARDEAKQAMIRADQGSKRAEAAYDSASDTLQELRNIKNRVDRESEKIQLLTLSVVRSRARDEIFELDRSCAKEGKAQLNEKQRNFNVERNILAMNWRKLSNLKQEVRDKGREAMCSWDLIGAELLLEKLHSETVDYEEEGFDVKEARAEVCRLARTIGIYTGTFTKNPSKSSYCKSESGRKSRE